MAKLRPVKTKKFKKFLETIGCYFVRNGGSHEIWKRGDLLRPLTVPFHKEVTVRVIKGNLKTLGMTPSKFKKIMEKI